jgi:hypothetical protein
VRPIPHSPTTIAVRTSLPRRLIAAGSALLALLPAAAFAQDAGGADDRDYVMIVTGAVIVLSLLACAVGYLYRRERGMDHPTPDEIEMMGGHGHGHQDEGHGTAVPAHAEAEHAVPAGSAPGVHAEGGTSHH